MRYINNKTNTNNKVQLLNTNGKIQLRIGYNFCGYAKKNTLHELKILIKNAITLYNNRKPF